MIPMVLNSVQLGKLAQHLDSSLLGQHLSKCIQISDDAWSFSLSRGGRLLINCSPNDPYVTISSSSLLVHGLSTPLSAYFRNKLSHARILQVESVPGERILSFSLKGTNEIFEEENLTLQIELIPHHPNLFLLDETGKILIAKRYSSITDQRVLLRGGMYSLPAPFQTNKKLDDAFDYDAYLQETSAKETSLLESRKTQKFEKLIKTLKTKKKAAERKIECILKDIDAASAHLNDGEYGQYIFTYLSSVQSETGVMDYYGTPIPLDPKKSNVQNAEAFFTRAKKAKTTISKSEEFLALAQKELERYSLLLDTLSISDEAALEAFTKEFHLDGKETDVIKKSPLGDSASLPYKVEYNGTTFWFGKSALQNDCLSFLYATKKDRLWFHVKNAHGAHLILQKDHPSNDDIFAACCFTLLASKKEDGEVQYTEHKFVKRGGVPGQAVLGSYQSAYIPHIPEEMKIAFKEAKKISFRH